MSMIEIVLGGSDNPESKKIGDEAKTRGAIVGETFSEILPALQAILKETKTPQLILSGGDLGICLRLAVEYAIAEGLPVSVDLGHSRIDPFDRGDKPNERRKDERLLALTSEMRPEVRESSNFKIVS